MKGGRNFMVAWLDIARRRERRRWEICYRTRKPIGLLDGPKESCTDARWTETCVAPIGMHLDGPSDVILAI